MNAFPNNEILISMEDLGDEYKEPQARYEAYVTLRGYFGGLVSWSDESALDALKQLKLMLEELGLVDDDTHYEYEWGNCEDPSEDADRDDTPEMDALINHEVMQGNPSPHDLPDPQEPNDDDDDDDDDIDIFSWGAKTEPDEEDYTIANAGYLGASTSLAIHGHKHLGTYLDEETAIAAALDHMNANNVFTDIWRLSDHGNWTYVEDTKPKETK